MSCIPEESRTGADFPTGENQLLTLHQVTNACRKLRSIEPQEHKWLTTKFREFPEAINEFIGRVSNYFHCYDITQLPLEYFEFVNGLSDFVKSYYVHIATLNYDNLLYLPFIEKDILKGYSGHLIDGFHSKGFKSENLDRLNKSLGWYLHLHGSPLFYETDSGTIKKYSKSKLEQSFASNLYRRHVVLCHTDNKPEVILESKLLSSYWRYFSKALRQTHCIYILGYGGEDEHLNKEISIWAEQQRNKNEEYLVKIIEYKNTDQELTERKEFWRMQLSVEYEFPIDNLKVKRMDNILKFDWAEEKKHL